MYEMMELLDELLSWMKKLNRPVIGFLQEGISKEMITSQIAPLSFIFPQDLLSLYMWRNGTRTPEGVTTDEVCFFPGYYFLSLDDAITNYKLLMNLKDDPRIIDDLKWKDAWFPIFTDAAGDYYAVDLGTNPVQESRVISCFSFAPPLGRLEYASLKHMMLTLLECYKTGVIFVDSKGFLDMDYDAIKSIATEYWPQFG
jgi:cell wall assembly regulator SMI1